MRWFVEISVVGGKPEELTALCVEAPQWQPALQKARALQGDNASLGNFSIELLDEGYRAIDPSTRRRYVVRRAPDDAKLTNGKASTAQEPRAASAPPPAPSKPPPAPSKPPPARSAEERPLPSFEVITSREEEPTETSPLTYREYAYAVAPETSEEDARRLVFDRFNKLRAELGDRSGQLVNLAVFDHKFMRRPQRRPIVTLSWKDWKGFDPEVHHPLREGVSMPPPVASISPPAAVEAAIRMKVDIPANIPLAPVKVADTPTPPVPKPEAAVASPPQPVKSEPPKPAPAQSEPPKQAAVRSEPPKAVKAEPVKSEPPKAEAAPSVKPQPAAAPAKAQPAPAAKAQPAKAPAARPGKRLSGDDLLTEMFDASGDLHFVRDALEGAEFVLRLIRENLPSEVGIVSLFDMNTREFVVVRQSGGAQTALCARQPEKAPLAWSVMRKRRAVVVNGAEDLSSAMDDRFRAIGLALKSLICSPIELNGRYIGVLEIANPIDGQPYDEGDGNALTYIAQQYAELVGERGVIVDPAAIRGETENEETRAPALVSSRPSAAPKSKRAR